MRARAENGWSSQRHVLTTNLAAVVPVGKSTCYLSQLQKHSPSEQNILSPKECVFRANIWSKQGCIICKTHIPKGYYGTCQIDDESPLYFMRKKNDETSGITGLRPTGGQRRTG